MFRSLTALTVSAVLLAGCSGGGGKKQEHRDGECDYSTLNSSNRPDVNLLWYHNAQFNDNRTVRWAHRDVLISVMDPRIDLGALRLILGEINVYIYPTRLVIADIPAIYSDVEIWYSPVLDNPDWLGQCTWTFGVGHFIVKAVVEIGDSAYGCHFYAVLKHELLHAVGIFEHTTDGGVMDAPTYNDVITQNVIDVLVPLYNFPAGTPVYP